MILGTGSDLIQPPDLALSYTDPLETEMATAYQRKTCYQRLLYQTPRMASSREGKFPQDERADNTVMTYGAVTDLGSNLPPLLGGTELDNSLVQFPQAQISVASPLSLKEMLGMSGLSW